MNRIHLPRRLRLAVAMAGLGAAALVTGCATPQDQQAAAAPASATPVAAAPAAPAPAPAQPEVTSAKERQHVRLTSEERMAQQRHAKYLAELKTALAITPAQEGAWNQFEAAMQPPAQMMQQRPEPDQWAKLNTPERIDRMDQLMAGRQQHFKQLGEATKAFYAQLMPAQQKTFDDRAMRAWSGHGQFDRRGKPVRHYPLRKPAAKASQAN